LVIFQGADVTQGLGFCTRKGFMIKLSNLSSVSETVVFRMKQAQLLTV